MNPSRRRFLRGLLAAGGAAAVVPALLGPERAAADEILLDLYGRKHVMLNGQRWEYTNDPLRLMIHDSVVVDVEAHPPLMYGSDGVVVEVLDVEALRPPTGTLITCVNFRIDDAVLPLLLPGVKP